MCLTLAAMEPTFGERLSSWLKFTGIKQADLARALVVSKAAVHGWTTDAAPTVDRIPPICAALGVSVAEFFARMPIEDAELNKAREEALAKAEAKRPKHPRTGDITREMDASAFQGSFAACPACGEPCSSCNHGEAA